MSEISNKQAATSATNADHDPFGAMEPVRLEATPGQFEMWFAEHAGTGASCAYNECFLIRLKGAVDDDALAEALTLIPTFHPALRGHFSASGEHFTIEPVVSASVTQHDFSDLAGEERALSVEQLAALDAQTPYDLSMGHFIALTRYAWRIVTSWCCSEPTTRLRTVGRWTSCWQT
jgi:hypothetical protein